MNQAKWYYHPFLVFIFSVLALGASLFLYIYWYMEVSTGIKAIVTKYNLEAHQALNPQTWLVVLVLSILVGIILLGIFTIFVYNHKTFQLYRTQRNFINNFTHELKTPVTSLKLYLETFHKHELAREDQLRYIGFMIQDVERLSGNINHILDLARIESKSYDFEVIEKDLYSVIETFIQNNSHLFRNCRITLLPSSDRPIPYRIHPPLFDMLLMNLIANAMSYNDSASPRVTIACCVKKRKLRITFADNGIGLTPREIRKVFKKFYRGRSSIQLSVKGSGIGLYLVQQIAGMHGGRVSAESGGIGKGSVFTVILPYKNRTGK